jgi:hypothetical protein
VPFLAVLWADGERAGDGGMAVVSGKWAQKARLEGDLRSALPVGRPYKPSVSPTSKKPGGHEIQQFCRTQLLPIHFKFFRHGYCRFESCPILAAPFEPITLQTCFTAHTQEWRIWLDNQLTRPASVTAQQSRRNTQAQQAAQVCRRTGSASRP